MTLPESSTSSRLVFLALDNSLDFLNVAVGTKKGLIEERHSRAENRSSEVIALRARTLLADHGLAPSDLAGIVVTLGPGSFTGVRVALAFCKGLSLGSGVPVVGVPTPEVLAAPFGFMVDGYVCTLVDAKKGEVFFSLFRVSSAGTIDLVDGHCATKPEEIERKILTPCLCVGSGTFVHRSVIENIEGVTIAADPFQRICGEMLLQRGMSRAAPVSGSPLRPLYGRKSEAEIKFGVDVG
jgi:tRNA threonylcarbamoyladenosine biosynthesis protein TsaB